MRGGAKVVIEPHRHAGIFIAKVCRSSSILVKMEDLLPDTDWAYTSG